MKKVVLACAFTLALSFVSVSQATQGGELAFVPSKLNAKERNVSYKGKTCSPSDPDSKVFSDTAEGVVRVGDEIFYQAHPFYVTGRGDGLVVEDTGKHTCQIYPMFSIAEAGGWYSRKNPADSTPDATLGLHRVGNKLWIGSNGVGVMVFDIKSRKWSRYDAKGQAIPGDHIGVNFADKDFVFVTHGEFPIAGFHIFSIKRNKWLGLKSVPTRLMRSYGSNTGMVQVIVNHRQYADKEFFPVDWSMMFPDISWSEADGAYIVEKDLGGGKTIFILPKIELERMFDQLR